MYIYLLPLKLKDNIGLDKDICAKSPSVESIGTRGQQEKITSYTDSPLEVLNSNRCNNTRVI